MIDIHHWVTAAISPSGLEKFLQIIKRQPNYVNLEVRNTGTGESDMFFIKQGLLYANLKARPFSCVFMCSRTLIFSMHVLFVFCPNRQEVVVVGKDQPPDLAVYLLDATADLAVTGQMASLKQQPPPASKGAGESVAGPG